MERSRALRRLLLLTAMFALTGAPLTLVHAESSVSPLPPVALPEAMTSAQMKAWKAELAAKNANPAATSSTPGNFYTGKPYIAETGGYAFKYREYNPEMARWTTVDPSGFPDGANNRVYAAVPTGEIDDNGLTTLKPGIPVISTARATSNKLLSFSFTSSSPTGGAEGVLVDGYNAVWSATISMTFNNPWPTSTDVATKDASDTCYTSVKSQLSNQDLYFILYGKGVGSAIDFSTSGLADTVGTASAAGWQSALDKLTGDHPVDHSAEQKAVESILNSPPSAASFAANFPGANWPLFSE